MKRLAAFAGTVRRLVRLRPLIVVVAMGMIHVSSLDPTWDGFIDRLVQIIIAYALICLAWPEKPNTTPQPEPKGIG